MVEFIFSEFGVKRRNGGGDHLDKLDRLEPSLTSIKRYFPDAIFTVYSDFDLKMAGVTLKKVVSPLDTNHPRFGYRSSDLFKFVGLMESKADLAIAMDSDMFIVSENVSYIRPITQRFGFCAPMNPRVLVKTDSIIGMDGSSIIDESGGYGFAINTTPLSFYTKNSRARKYLEACVNIMHLSPARAPLIMWQAMWESGFTPYLLPPQWCVCETQESIGDEIILHVGHRRIIDYYKIKL
ncbi:MAG TPA: hypothetical protein VFW78_07825 [Bacteroidia bacterium]|nr:hypothetical protein [Bacteroidia bacterium]